MNWIEIGMLIALFIGIACGGLLLANHSDFWIDLGSRTVTTLFSLGSKLFIALWPQIIQKITAQMTKEEIDEWHLAERRGDGSKYMQDHLKKKLKPIFGAKKNG